MIRDIERTSEKENSEFVADMAQIPEASEIKSEVPDEFLAVSSLTEPITCEKALDVFYIDFDSIGDGFDLFIQNGDKSKLPVFLNDKDIVTDMAISYFQKWVDIFFEKIGRKIQIEYNTGRNYSGTPSRGDVVDHDFVSANGHHIFVVDGWYNEEGVLRQDQGFDYVELRNFFEEIFPEERQRRLEEEKLQRQAREKINKAARDAHSADLSRLQPTIFSPDGRFLNEQKMSTVLPSQPQPQKKESLLKKFLGKLRGK